MHFIKYMTAVSTRLTKPLRIRVVRRDRCQAGGHCPGEGGGGSSTGRKYKVGVEV